MHDFFLKKTLRITQAVVWADKNLQMVWTILKMVSWIKSNYVQVNTELGGRVLLQAGGGTVMADDASTVWQEHERGFTSLPLVMKTSGRTHKHTSRSIIQTSSVGRLHLDS